MSFPFFESKATVNKKEVLLGRHQTTCALSTAVSRSCCQVRAPTVLVGPHVVWGSGQGLCEDTGYSACPVQHPNCCSFALGNPVFQGAHFIPHLKSLTLKRILVEGVRGRMCNKNKQCSPGEGGCCRRCSSLRRWEAGRWESWAAL